MSVDTTVVILKTGDEYRVTTVQAAENITEYKDIEVLHMLFDKTQPVKTLDEAYVLAQKEEEHHKQVMGYTSEYGVRIVDWGGPYPQ